MKKTDDFFAAGVIIGSIGNVSVLIIAWISLLIGIKIRTPWNDMALLLFKPPEANSFWAILLGYIISFGVAILNGVITGGLLSITGRDFAYLKSVVISVTTLFFTYTVLYPLIRFFVLQHSIVTVYHALFNNIQFAVLTAFLFLRFTSVGLKNASIEDK